MKTVFATLAVFAVLTASRALADSHDADEKGFVPLVKGDSHAGLRGYKSESFPKGWEVKDGVLHRTTGGDDVMTVKKYDSFDLRFEWKIAPGGNSGVMYRVATGDDAPYWTGPEYQVLDKEEGVGPKHQSGALYDLYPAEGGKLKPEGQWNSSRIVVRGDHVEHWLNGKKVVEFTFGSDEYKKRVAASKFASWKEFGKHRKGHIDFQDHGAEVWYRNVRIKPLKGE